MKHLITVFILGLLEVSIIGCKPRDTAPENAGIAPGSPAESNDLVKTQTASKPPVSQLEARLMEMEQRNKDGDITSLNDPDGLWHKRGESHPYTGIVAGYYKAKKGEEAIMASKREYKNGTQVGTETNWYENGKKRIELTYENGDVVSIRQWDADGNQLK